MPMKIMTPIKITMRKTKKMIKDDDEYNYVDKL